MFTLHKQIFKTSLLMALMVLAFSSCTVMKDKLASKRYKQAVAEREQLKREKKFLLSDTTSRGVEYRQLLGEHTQLKDKYQALDKRHTELYKDYQALLNSSSSKAEQMNAALKNKQLELDRKEGILKDKERLMAEMQSKLQRQDSISQALNKLIANALLGFSSDELSVEQRGGKVYVSMSDKLLFKSGSAGVESKGQEAIRKLGEVLAKQSDIDILIEGHTDNVPIKTSLYKDNWDLSVARATTIVRLLSTQHQIAPTRLTASGKGEHFPVAPNDAAEGKARNRRTEIILSPKLDDLFKMLQTTSL